MLNLCIALVTSRHFPHFDWFFDSLAAQPGIGQPQVIVIDHHIDMPGRKLLVDAEGKRFTEVLHRAPKPTVWSGPHRITKEDWWSVSNSRNTALCYCERDYIVWCDDRSVLGPKWLEGVKASITGKYAVCGTYEKRHGMDVRDGRIVHAGELSGRDMRDNLRSDEVQDCFGQYWGGTYGMPTEMALAVNAYEENCDGAGAEDTMMGLMLMNSGFPTKFDPRIKLIQDRTPGQIGPTMRKEDKGKSPNDKSHAALARFGVLKQCAHPWNFREIRMRILNGGEFPNTDAFPKNDWYDGEPISSM